MKALVRVRFDYIFFVAAFYLSVVAIVSTPRMALTRKNSQATAHTQVGRDTPLTNDMLYSSNSNAIFYFLYSGG